MLLNFIIDKNIVFPVALEWLIENGILNKAGVSSVFSKEKDLYLTIELKVAPNLLIDYMIKFNHPDLYLTNVNLYGIVGFTMSEYEDEDDNIENLFIPFSNISCIYKKEKSV